MSEPSVRTYSTLDTITRSDISRKLPNKTGPGFLAHRLLCILQAL